MPTLLTINNYHYRRGGADVAYLAHGEIFEQNGWTVSYFSMHHENNLPSPWARYFVQEIEFGRSYGPARTLQNAFKAVYSFEAASKIDSLVTAQPPDVAHAHNIYHHLSPSILKALKKRGVPVFLTVHDAKLLCPARTMYRSAMICEDCRGGALRNVVANRCLKDSLPLSALIYVESRLHRMLGLYGRYVDRFVAPSRFLIDKFVEWGWHADRFVHIPNFVDATRHSPEFSAGEPFIYFGRLSHEKGLATLIRACARVRVPLWLVGDGPEEPKLRVLAEAVGAKVEFYGFRTGNDLWSLVRLARAVVLPSECYENAPISILEAYSLGKPVIGARIGGIPELVRECETGWSFPSADVDGLATVLEAVAAAPAATVAEMGREARRWVAAEFSAQRHYERLMHLYGQQARVQKVPEDGIG